MVPSNVPYKARQEHTDTCHARVHAQGLITGTVRPMTAPSDTNQGPFSILGLEPRFDLAPEAIERAFLLRVASVHPDHAPDNDDEPAAVAALNTAREQLLDPERRAGVLLNLMGGSAASEDRSLPEGFLLEMLETRQTMEEELASDPLAALKTWTLWAMQRRATHIEVLKGLFPKARGDREVLTAVRCELNAWRYIERLIEQLDPAGPRPPQ